jgi:hypothetical protein
MELFVFVGCWGLNLNDVRVFIREEDAITAWEKYTGKNYEEFKKHMEEHNDDTTFMDPDYSNTSIWKKKIEVIVRDEESQN